MLIIITAFALMTGCQTMRSKPDITDPANVLADGVLKEFLDTLAPR
jgi:uncharacterized lipoprotein YajG